MPTEAHKSKFWRLAGAVAGTEFRLPPICADPGQYSHKPSSLRRALAGSGDYEHLPRADEPVGTLVRRQRGPDLGPRLLAFLVVGETDGRVGEAGAGEAAGVLMRWHRSRDAA